MKFPHPSGSCFTFTSNLIQSTPPGLPAPPRLPGAKSDSKKAVITPCHKPTFVGFPYMGRGICLFEFLEKLLLSHSGVKKGCANAQPRGIITHDSV